jgi:hypothetical protein
MSNHDPYSDSERALFCSNPSPGRITTQDGSSLKAGLKGSRVIPRPDSSRRVEESR